MYMDILVSIPTKCVQLEQVQSEMHTKIKFKKPVRSDFKKNRKKFDPKRSGLRPIQSGPKQITYFSDKSGPIRYGKYPNSDPAWKKFGFRPDSDKNLVRPDPDKNLVRPGPDRIKPDFGTIFPKFYLNISKNTNKILNIFKF